MPSRVWKQYQHKLSRATSLAELIIRKRCHIRGYGLKYKVEKGFLVSYRYNK